MQSVKLRGVKVGWALTGTTHQKLHRPMDAWWAVPTLHHSSETWILLVDGSIDDYQFAEMATQLASDPSGIPSSRPVDSKPTRAESNVQLIGNAFVIHLVHPW